ncbi:hypothetical protein [Microbacterium luteum]|uniref:hypothetical protein n=1 Tax=Microbacterium luteum TaxID=2782167 RepID=UPI0018889026|nr:hypothetical protein [Microbacterium luteum]
MASEGLQPGYEDAPAFPEEGPLASGADLEEVARLAVKRGNTRKGTTAERDAYTPVNGMLWSNTTTGAVERWNGSAWQFVMYLVDWTTLAATNDWTANTGEVSPQVSRDGYMVSYHGGMYGGTSSSAAAQLPAWSWPKRDTRLPVIMSDNSTIGRCRISPTGGLFFSGGVSQDAALTWSVV